MILISRKINKYISFIILMCIVYQYGKTSLPKFSVVQENKHCAKEKENRTEVLIPKRHKDLHPKQLQLINITNFEIPINVDICNVTKIALVSIIHSACHHKWARDVIRQTWGHPDIPNVQTRLVFLVGLTSDKKLQQELVQESEAMQDLVQGAFIDNYKNMSYKNVFGKLWVSKFCEQAEFVVKTDDDIFVDLYAVYKITRSYLNKQEYINNKFLLCPVFPNGRGIDREAGHRWFVSFEELPRNKTNHHAPDNSTDFYPAYCPGAIWILNPGTAGKLAQMGNNAKRVDFLWIDDAWVTGYLAADLEIKHLDFNEFWTWNKERFIIMKLAQNADIFHKDYISTPMSRDYGTSLTLHKHARWCYFNKCLSNIYQPERNISKDDQTIEKTLDKYFPP